MSKVKVEVNYAGVGELLKSKELESYMKETASSIASGLGSGYGYSTKKLGTRVVASVTAFTDEAARENAQNNTLLRAVSK